MESQRSRIHKANWLAPKVTPMSEFVLAIDGGGSKTLALLQNLSTGQTWQQRAGGSSLTIDFDSACKTIIELATNLAVQAAVVPKSVVLVCGVAGAGNDKRRIQLENQLKAIFKDALVVNDGKTSLYGAGGGAPVVVVALGTGSVAMRLDQNGQKKQFGGWGFTASDGGSGANIGRKIVKETLFAFDRMDDEVIAFCRSDKKIDPLVSACLDVIGYDSQTILDWLNQATASAYATLAPLVFKHRDTSPLASTIIDKTLEEVKALIDLAQPEEQLPVVVIGGVADALIPDIASTFDYKIKQAKGDSLDGALHLAKIMVNFRDKSAFYDESI